MSIGTDVMYCNEYDSFVVQLGEAVTRGDVVGVKTDGKGYKACAATGATNVQPAVGIAEVAGAIGDWINVKHSGKVFVTGLTPGLVYLSDTAGKISQTPGTNPQIIGFAVKADEWVMAFDLKYGTAGADAYYKPDAGIPEDDLAAAVVAKLDAGDSAYQLPETGIPATDLAEAVQTSLGKADDAAPAADLASTDAGKGASLIGFEAIAGLTATADLRAALVEIVGRLVVLETPGG